MQQYNYNLVHKAFMTLSLVSLLSACASTTTLTSAQSPDTKGVESQDTNISRYIYSTDQRISGTLLDVDGKTPVSGATIYVANHKTAAKGMLNNLSLNSTDTLSDSCNKPLETHTAYTCSRADGSFELVVNQIAQLPLPLIMKKGDKRIQINLDLNDLGTNIGAVAFHFPEPQDSQKRSIAIVLDFFNPFDDLKTQLRTGQYNSQTAFEEITNQFNEIFEVENNDTNIAFPEFKTLFEDNDGDNEADIFNYDVVYINSRDEIDVSRLDKEQKQHLLKFITLGGQFYVTEWSFELPEIPLDQYI